MREWESLPSFYRHWTTPCPSHRVPALCSRSATCAPSSWRIAYWICSSRDKAARWPLPWWWWSGPAWWTCPAWRHGFWQPGSSLHRTPRSCWCRWRSWRSYTFRWILPRHGWVWCGRFSPTQRPCPWLRWPERWHPGSAYPWLRFEWGRYPCPWCVRSSRNRSNKACRGWPGCCLGADHRGMFPHPVSDAGSCPLSRSRSRSSRSLLQAAFPCRRWSSRRYRSW